MSFCSRLLEARLKLGLTQEQLAKKIGVKRVTVNWWENPQEEENYPNAKNLDNLAKALNVDPAWLRFDPKRRSEKNIQQKDDIHQDKINILVHGHNPLSMKEIGEWLKSNASLIKKGVNNMSSYEKKKAMFSVVIENDAMISNRELDKNLLIGDRVWVSAVFDKINSGDIVCARFGKSNNFKFRRYSRDGEEEVLSALNDKYPNVIVDESVEICGIVKNIIRTI